MRSPFINAHACARARVHASARTRAQVRSCVCARVYAHARRRSVLDSSRMLLRLVGHRLAEMEMDNLLTKAVAWLALAFAAVSVAAWCYAIVRAMFTSGSG